MVLQVRATNVKEIKPELKIVFVLVKKKIIPLS